MLEGMTTQTERLATRTNRLFDLIRMTVFTMVWIFWFLFTIGAATEHSTAGTTVGLTALGLMALRMIWVRVREYRAL